MPEKTLKEKVEFVRAIIQAVPTKRLRAAILEALTALEARVEELEEENEKLKNPVPGYTTGQW